jgi:hypothetical protein
VRSRAADSAVVSCGCCWPTYAKPAHPVNQRGSLHTKPFGGAISATDYPIARFQCSKNMISLDFLKGVNRHIELPL